MSEQLSKKNYWKLSEFAKSIIEQDLEEYNKQISPNGTKWNRTDIYNIIFKHYRKDAISSICLDNSNDLTEKQREKVNSKLKEIIDKKYLYDEGIRQNYRFSSGTCVIMEENKNRLNLCSIRPGRYFRAVLEEYAHLPGSEREKILYKLMYNNLKEHLIKSFYKAKPVLIEVYSSNYNGELKRSRYLFYPYKILPDKKLMRNYVVGLSKTVGTDQAFSQYPLRLSNICSIKSAPKKTDTLSTDELKKKISDIDKKLKKVDVPFINSTFHDNLQVRFTETGLGLLHRVQYKRPPFDYSTEDDHICLFHCTEDELFNYITVFGGEAVLEDADNDEGIRNLQKRLQAFYSKANEAYNSQK